MGWKIEYWDGSSWVTLDGQLVQIVQELNGTEYAEFIIANNETNRSIVAQDRDVRISYDTTVVFKGILSAVEYGIDTIKCIIYNKCYEKMKTKDFTGTYRATAANTILSAICSAAGVVAGSCPTTTVSVRFNRAICFDAATFLADALNKDFWSDEDASGNPRFNIGDRVNSTPYPSITPISWPARGIDRSKKRDKVIIRGVDADGNYIEGSAGTGTNVAVFTEKKASDVATLNSLAAKKLAELNKESSGVALPVSIAQAYNLLPGYYVTLNKPELNLSGDFRIWRITKKPDVATVEVDRAQELLEQKLEQTKQYEDYGIYVFAAPTEYPAPSAPTSISAVANTIQNPDGSTATYFTVTIGRVEGVKGYKVRYRKLNTTYWFVLDVPQPPTGDVTVNTYEVEQNVTYQFQACTYNEIETLSDWYPSTPYTATSGKDITPPAAPTGLTATARVASIFLKWNANSEPDVKEYIIYRGTSSNPTTEYTRTRATSYIDNNVSYGTTYYYRLKAVDWSENASDYSMQASASPLQVASPDIAPDAVSAEKILAGAVTDVKLASGAVTLAKFASGLRPVQIMNSLPSLPDSNYPQGAVVFLTTDNKLYRSTGSSWTAVVPTTDLTGQITTSQLADSVVTAAKIQDGAVTDTKLASGAVTLTKFASGIRPVQIVSSLPSLPDPNYPEGAVVYLTTDDKLYRSTGTSWTAAVPTTDLTGQITETQIADNAISTPKLQANAVVADKIAANAITSDKIAANAVTAGKIAAGAVSTDQLAANAVTAAKIQAGAVTASKLSVAQIFIDGPTWTDNSPSSGYVSWTACTVYYQGTAYLITPGYTNLKYIYWNVGDTVFTASDTKPSWAETRFLIAINEGGYHKTVWNATLIHGGALVTGSITAQEIAAGTITGDKIAAGTITGDKIAANTITGSNIAVDTITAGNIAAGAIGTSELAAGAVTADKIQAGAVSASKLAVAQIFIDGLNFTDNTPSAGYVAWSACTVYYKGTNYSISPGFTNCRYIFWTVGNTTFDVSIIKPNWSDTTFMIAINEGGYHKTVWNATLIHGGTIIAGSITAQEIAAGTITGDKIAANTITADHIVTGAITPIKLNTDTWSNIDWRIAHVALSVVWGGAVY